MRNKTIFRNPKTGLLIQPSEVAGQVPLTIASVSAAYNISPDDQLILVDCTGAAVTVTLPRASQNTGKRFTIKKIDSSGNAVTVAPFSTATIDGAATATISTQYVSLVVISDGTNWQTVAPAGGTFAGGTITAATTVSVASATALVVGPNGTTNPTLTVDTNTASAVTGLKIAGAAAGGQILLSVLSSGTNEGLTITSKGTGNIIIKPGGNVTSAVNIADAAGSIFLRADSTNKRVGIGASTAPSNTLDVFGGNIRGAAATATPAGGSTTVALLLGSANVGVYMGSGAPTVTAAQGSIYLRTDGSSTSTRVYVNSDGGTTWVAVTTAS
jgi:hypothetical protein